MCRVQQQCSTAHMSLIAATDKPSYLRPPRNMLLVSTASRLEQLLAVIAVEGLHGVQHRAPLPSRQGKPHSAATCLILVSLTLYPSCMPATLTPQAACSSHAFATTELSMSQHGSSPAYVHATVMQLSCSALTSAAYCMAGSLPLLLL